MKRGEIAVLLLLIVLGIVLLVSLGIFMVIKEIYDETEEDAYCASQIRAHAAAVRFTGELGAPPIVCPTRNLTIDAKKDDANAALADEMRRCWDQWGRGELQLFGDVRGTYCHVCSVVRVEGADAIVGFPKYLDSAQVPDSDVSYAQHFAGQRKGEYFADEKLKDAAIASMPADRPLGVVFYYQKGMTAVDQAINKIVLNPGTGAGAGGIVGGAAGTAAGVGTVKVATSVVAVSAGTAAVVVGTGLVTGAAVGSAVGLATVLIGRQEHDYLAAVVVRPLDVQYLQDELGCQYAPVAEG